MSNAIDKTAQASVGFGLRPGDLSSAIDPEILEKMKGAPDDEWYKPEKPPVSFVRVRQKDLVDAAGETVRRAGAFRFGKVDDLSSDDVKTLRLTIFAFSPGRVYYQDVKDDEPTCDSRDAVHGSRAAEQVDGKMVYGECAKCWLSQRGSGVGGEGRKACRENRSIFALNLETETPVILTIGPSSLSNFAKYDSYISSESAKAFGPESVKSLHHMAAITASLEYKREPAGHYVVKWNDAAILPKSVQQMMASLKEEALERFKEASKAQPIEKEDYVGTPGSKVSPPESVPAADGSDLPF